MKETKFAAALPEKRIYKYRALPRISNKPDEYDEHALGYVRDIFTKSQLYFPSPADLNDPHECRPFFKISDLSNAEFRERYVNYVVHSIQQERPNADLAKARAWAQGHTQKEAQELATNAATAYQQNLFGKYRICGFSASNSEPLLWSHYSASHKGVCLVFDARNDIFGTAVEVQYDDQYPIVPAVEVENQELLFKSIMTKYSAWKYEREYRLISMEPNNPGALPVKDKKFNFPKEMLVGVIFGFRAPIEDKQLIREWCADRKDFQFYEAKLNETAYQLDISRI